MPRIVTFNLDNLDEVSAIYLVDLLNEKLQQDDITKGLESAAWELAEREYTTTDNETLCEIADGIYPQCASIWTESDRPELVRKRDEHLRHFGIVREAE